MLRSIAPPDYLGRVSGWGWSLGYAGGPICLVAALFDPNDAHTARARPEADDALTSQLDRSLGAIRSQIPRLPHARFPNRQSLRKVE
jgi:hypothetical protein